MRIVEGLRPAFAGVSVLLVAGSVAVAAQWPMERQNPYRTATVAGTGQLTNPAVRGRVYLGGDADPLTTWVGDVNQDEATEILMTVGGKVLMKDTADRVLWDTPSLQAGQIFGAFDFDGDGRLELLVLGDDGLRLLDARDGTIRWHITGFMEGNNRAQVAGTRVADINGDGLPDIVFKAYWTSDGLVHAYTFDNGIDTETPEANELWRHDIEPGYDKGYFPAVGDVDDDGVPEVVSSTGTILEVFPADTGGSSKWLVDLHRSIYYGRTQILNIDGDPQNEIIHCTQSSSKSLEVFDLVRVTDGPIAEVVWDAGDRVFVPTYAVHDLDGDGVFEIGVSRYDTAGGTWEGRVYQYVEPEEDPADARLEEAMVLPDEQIVDFADLDGDGVLDLLTRVTAPGTSAIPPFYTIRARRFDSDATLIWELDGARWHLVRDRGQADLNPTQSSGRVARQDVDGDGIPEVYVSRDTDGDLVADRLDILKTQQGGVETVASLSLAPENRMTILWTREGISGSTGGAEVLTLDLNGRLWVLGPDLAPAVETPMEVGGFYAHPAQVVDLDGDGIHEMLVRKSSGLLTAIRPEEIDQTGDLDAALWSFDGNVSKQYAVALDVDDDGASEVVVRDSTDDAVPRLVLLAGDGSALGAVDLDSAPFNLLPAPLVGSDGPDVFGMQWTTDGRIELFVIDGETWSMAWHMPAPYQDGAHAEDNTAVVLDFDENGTLDIGYGQDRYFCVSSGLTGESLGCASPDFYGGGAMTGPVLEGGVDGVALVSSDHVTLLDLALAEQTVADFEGVARLSRQAAIADADEDGTLELFFLGDNRVYRYDGGTESWSTALEGGSVGADNSGIVLNGMAVGDIDGDGALELVVGSSDGFLYALDAHTGALEWAFQLYYEVGRPVIACVDDDDSLDVAVPVGDGHLYVFNQATLPTPDNVRDVAVQDDLTLGPLDEDVDDTEVAERLGAAWDSVPGAAGYLVAVVSEHGSYVVDWQDVGDQTSVLITESRLLLGQQYHVLVQAYDQARDGSPWAQSDGVQIQDVSPPRLEEIRAVPNPFNPDLTDTMLQARVHDPTGLVDLSVAVLDGTEVLFRQSWTVSGTSRNLETAWDGRDLEGTRVPDGIYDIEVRATDVGGHEAVGTGTVEVTSAIPTPTPVPQVTPTPSAPVTPSPTPAAWTSPTPTGTEATPTPGDDDTGEVEPTSPDPGGEESPTPGADDSGSCNCHTGTGRPDGGVGWGYLLLLSPFVVVWRRRQRRPLP